MANDMKRIGIWLGVALAALLAIDLGLHFGQKRHNHLNFDIAAEFPPDQPFVPGEIYAATLAAIMDHELHDGFGWRPNDFYLWGPHVMADNNANRQLGIILAVRETMRVFKDHLTKISSNEYDPNLVIADTDFRNDATRWMFPAAETQIQRRRHAICGCTSPDCTPRRRLRASSISATSSWCGCSSRGATCSATPTRTSIAPKRTTAARSIRGTPMTTSTTRKATRMSSTT